MEAIVVIALAVALGILLAPVLLSLIVVGGPILLGFIALSLIVSAIVFPLIWLG